MMKVGTVGTGMVMGIMMGAMQEAEGICVEAVFSRSAERGREFADKFGVAKTYTRYEDLLAYPEVNWVYVCSPNSVHYSQTMQALEAGKNVLCEKPFATNAAQAEEMFAKAQEKGLLLYEALTSPFLANYHLMKEQLERIGKVKMVLAGYSQYDKRYDAFKAGEMNNAFDPNMAGGSLMDLNYYNVALLVSLYGEPERAFYAANVERGIDTSGIAILTYPGFVAECHGGKDVTGENGVQFQGENGMVQVVGPCNSMAQIKATVRDPEDPNPFGGWKKEEFPGTAPFTHWKEEVRELARIVNSGDQADFERRKATTLGTMRTIDRLRKSAGVVFLGD